MRQRQLRHTFLAHDAPVKSIVVDENEEFFISGSEDGDIKVVTSLVILLLLNAVYNDCLDLLGSVVHCVANVVSCLHAKTCFCHLQK